MLYELIPTMPEHRLRPLIEEFALKLGAQPVLNEMFGAIKNEGGVLSLKAVMWCRTRRTEATRSSEVLYVW